MKDTELLVHDAEEDCPYLPGQVSRLPLRLQLAPLRDEALDEALAAGDRRVGRMVYRTSCPDCVACEPLRLATDTFRPTASQRRVARRNGDVRVQIGQPIPSPERLDLFNRHRLERDLSTSGKAMTPDDYQSWFLTTCSPTVEMAYLVGDRLVGVGIVDVGLRDTSSVYFYFDPDESHRSLGTYSVLREVEWLRARGGRHHYLGLYVADCDQLNYKTRFLPHERRIDGAWRRFDGSTSET